MLAWNQRFVELNWNYMNKLPTLWAMTIIAVTSALVGMFIWMRTDAMIASMPKVESTKIARPEVSVTPTPTVTPEEDTIEPAPVTTPTKNTTTAPVTATAETPVNTPALTPTPTPTPTETKMTYTEATAKCAPGNKFNNSAVVSKWQALYNDAQASYDRCLDTTCRSLAQGNMNNYKSQIAKSNQERTAAEQHYVASCMAQYGF